jgi:hypothetical protein
MGELLKVLDKLTARIIAGVIVLALGAVLAIGASAGGLPQYGLAVTEDVWRIFLAILGIIIGFVGLFLILSDKDTVKKSVDVSRTGITITHAHQRPNNLSEVLISGTCKELPEGYDLWLFNADASGRKRYWPIAQLFVKSSDWTVTHKLKGWGEGHERHYVAFLVGEDGKKLVNHYRSAGEVIEAMFRHFKSLNPGIEVREDTPGRNWPELTDLTTDTIQAAELRIKLEGSSDKAARGPIAT